MTDDLPLVPAVPEGLRPITGAAGAALGNELPVEPYAEELRGFFRKRARGMQDDLVQATLLACLEAAPRYRADASLRAFVFGVARNLLFSHYRRIQRDGAIAHVTLSQAPASAASPHRELEAAEHLRQLHGVLRRLSREHQVVLALVYWNGLTGPALARALGVPLDTAYSRLRRAKEHFRRLAREEDLVPDLDAELELDAWADPVCATHDPSGPRSMLLDRVSRQQHVAPTHERNREPSRDREDGFQADRHLFGGWPDPAGAAPA